jgi:hypothetical protein
MILFSIATWVLFGLTIGGMVSFFMEKRRHTGEHLLAAVGGAFFGGVLGMFAGAFSPALAWEVRGYSITSLLLALACSAVFVVIERNIHRRGRLILNDPRPDVP